MSEQGCKYCSWIDPALIEDDEADGPMNYCRVCGRDLRVPETAQKTGQEVQDADTLQQLDDGSTNGRDAYDKLAEEFDKVFNVKIRNEYGQ